MGRGRQGRERVYSKGLYAGLLKQLNDKKGELKSKDWQKIQYYDDYYPDEATGTTFFKKVRKGRGKYAERELLPKKDY